MRRWSAIALITAVFLTACGSAGAKARLAQQWPTVLVGPSDFRTTVMVHLGQTIQLDLPGWYFAFPSRLLQALPGQASSGQSTLRAVGVGNELITGEQPPLPVLCPYGEDCAYRGPSYASFLLVVVPSDESFDLAVSEMDNGRRFLLTPGMRIVAAAPITNLAVGGPKVLAAKPLTDGSLSIVTALGPGHSRVLSHYTGLGTGFTIDVLVRPAVARYDAVFSNQDAGRTIHAKVGQTIQFRLVETAGYSRWVSDSWGFFLLPMTDPSADQKHNAWIAYEVVAAYRMSLQFREVPDCYGQRSCQLPWRTIAFDVVATA